MVMLTRAAIALALCALASAASSQNQPTYASLWQAVANDPDCTSAQYPDLTLVTCKQALALWYFTKPNHPAHPGVIKRAIVQDAAGISSRLSGWSFGPDAAQPAFKAWLAQIQDLDRQAKEYLEKNKRQ